MAHFVPAAPMPPAVRSGSTASHGIPPEAALYPAPDDLARQRAARAEHVDLDRGQAAGRDADWEVGRLEHDPDVAAEARIAERGRTGLGRLFTDCELQYDAPVQALSLACERVRRRDRRRQAALHVAGS